MSDNVKPLIFYLLSLGCPKNEVDSESVSANLTNSGYLSTDDPKEADILLINTCGFLEAAVSEAIEAILELSAFKRECGGNARYLIVMGCMSQRYGTQIMQAMPEVDAILGTAEYDRVTEVIAQLIEGKTFTDHRPCAPGSLTHLNENRIPSNGNKSYAYIKIAEGCSNGCAYCIIPRLRGPNRSRDPESILREAKSLTAQGKQELILVAQDTTRYGMDLNPPVTLASLLRRLRKELPDYMRFRIMYAYADAVTEALIHEMAENPGVFHYIDLPIQHASDRVLQRMRRHETSELIADRIAMMRRAMPDLIIRTTVMVGFPGETEEDVDQLIDFMKKIQFDRLGCFIFSPEEGSRAFSMPDKIDFETAKRRFDRVMMSQQAITETKNKARIGEVVPVYFEDIDQNGILFEARSYGEAPEIDPAIRVASTQPGLRIGSRPLVRIVDAGPYDLVGVTVDELTE